MWLYNRIILLTIILLLPKTSVIEASSEPLTNGKYWSESEKDWSDVTIKFDMEKKIMSVYNRGSRELIAKFDPHTFVITSPIQIDSTVLSDIQEAIANKKISLWVSLTPLVAAGVIEARYGKFTFIGRLVRSPYVRYLIKVLPLGALIPKKDELQYHNYFGFFGKRYLLVRVEKKKDEFLKKTMGLFEVASAQLPPKVIADKYLIHAEQLYAAKDYVEAFNVMEKILALQKEHSLTLPDEFHFKYAQVALSADSTRIGLESVNKYLSATGEEGEFYALPLTQDAQTTNTTLWGALAIDSNQGPSWGWAINYPTVQQAEQRALAECGNNCHVVMRFSNECGAFAADQEPGSTIYGWGKADSGVAAQNRALSECRRRGGTSCRVRAWGCTQR